MNRIVSFILLLLFGFYAFSNVVILANYYTSTSSYAAHCENKNKTWMHCNGQCQLKKQMDQTENQNQSQKKGQPTETLIFIATSFDEELSWKIETNSTFQDSNTCKTINRPRSYFHPPNQL